MCLTENCVLLIMLTNVFLYITAKNPGPIVFLQVQHNVQNRRDILKCQHVGKDSSMSLLRKTCEAERIAGTDFEESVTTHCYCGTIWKPISPNYSEKKSRILSG